MPNIRGYEAPQNLGLNPTEIGVDATAAAARRIGGFYNQKADALNQEGGEIKSTVADVGQVALSYINQKDRSDVSVAATGALAKLDQAWNIKTKGNGLDPSDPNYIPPADPRDPTVAQKFMQEHVEPALQNLDGIPIGEAGKDYAQNQINQIRSHLSQKLTADMSTMAGEAAVLKDRQTTNNLSNMVTTSPDFHSVDMALSMHKDASAGWTSNPNITGDQLGKMNEHFQASQEQIVHAAAAAAISKARDPQAVAAAFIKRYPDYIKGDEANTLAKGAQMQTKSNALVDKQTQVTQQKLDDLQVHQGATKIMSDNISFDPTTGRPIVDPKFFSQALDLARKNPNATNAAETVRTMFSWGEGQQSKADHATDPATAAAIDSRMFVSDNPVSKIDIMRAEADKKMSRPDAEIRMKIIDQRDKVPTDPQFKFAMDGAKELIDGRTPGEKSMQAGKYAAFMQDFLRQYQTQKAAGTLPADALSLRNPNSLISKAMESYKSPLAAAISGNGGISTAPAPSNIPAPATTSRYQSGDVVNTSEGPRRFKGGDFRNKANWEPVS